VRSSGEGPKEEIKRVKIERLKKLIAKEAE